MDIKRVVSGQIEVNCYIIYDEVSKKAVIIDPGTDFEKVTSEIEQFGLIPELLINTHGHWDHIFSDDSIRAKYNIPLAISAEDAKMLSDAHKNASFFMGCSVEIKAPEIILKDGEKLKTSFCEFDIVSTPGHTKGGVCLVLEDNIFTGDTLFAGSVGRTDLPGGNMKEMQKSLSKLIKFGKNLKVFPGHGPASTLENEMRHNPFLTGDSGWL
jgi:glyoxylase-like metal-dependent hydrolase (beta-lactamase superfamily II)